MEKKTVVLLVLVAVIILAGVTFFFLNRNNTSDSLIEAQAPKVVVPSDTFIEYSDPAGFTFNYPDNLSLVNKAVSDDSADFADPDIYAQLQLFSNDKSGSLNLKITDTEFESLDEWLKSENIAETNVPVEKQFGGMKALEVKTSDRVMLASLDQGVLFMVDMPRIEEDFWVKVYDKVTSDFTFAAPETAQAQSAAAPADEVIFEGEEVIE